MTELPTRAMLLAAGLGTRLRPLTDRTPKPLLPVNSVTLLERHLFRLAQAGIEDVVINLHHLSEQITGKIGDGSRYGVSVQYSQESKLLETGGGIKQALPLLGQEPFIVISADIYIDFDFAELKKPLPSESLAHLVMVENPEHHPTGDFAVSHGGVLAFEGNRKTWASVMVMRPELVTSVTEPRFKLRKVFDQSIERGQLSGELYQGYWCDVGTIERYNGLLAHLEQVSSQ